MRPSVFATVLLAGLLGTAHSMPQGGAAPLGKAADVRKGPSGQAVPRFVSLKTGKVNARRGPSFSQPVLWQYQRAGLPLRITAESGAWRRIEDLDGAQAWVHAATLSPQRTAIVISARTAIRSTATIEGRPRAWLETGVVADLVDCKGSWRKLSIKGRSGWIPAASVWGAPNCEEPAASTAPGA